MHEHPSTDHAKGGVDSSRRLSCSGRKTGRGRLRAGRNGACVCGERKGPAGSCAVAIVSYRSPRKTTRRVEPPHLHVRQSVRPRAPTEIISRRTNDRRPRVRTLYRPSTTKKNAWWYPREAVVQTQFPPFIPPHVLAKRDTWSRTWDDRRRGRARSDRKGTDRYTVSIATYAPRGPRPRMRPEAVAIIPEEGEIKGGESRQSTRAPSRRCQAGETGCAGILVARRGGRKNRRGSPHRRTALRPHAHRHPLCPYAYAHTYVRVCALMGEDAYAQSSPLESPSTWPTRVPKVLRENSAPPSCTDVPRAHGICIRLHTQSFPRGGRLNRRGGCAPTPTRYCVAGWASSMSLVMSRRGGRDRENAEAGASASACRGSWRPIPECVREVRDRGERTHARVRDASRRFGDGLAIVVNREGVRAPRARKCSGLMAHQDVKVVLVRFLRSPPFPSGLRTSSGARAGRGKEWSSRESSTRRGAQGLDAKSEYCWDPVSRGYSFKGGGVFLDKKGMVNIRIWVNLTR
ncbi:hypothetical protein C8F04DRAFT_1197657 [Mycena alexandri]|uniref:Uncharacterized protein n=1 Tax=Mycena alexandri TaxID=1745969 RepID=A0AAD6S268_9AGAR|nr:hypothetical protein C8F04DRAFT_1197657 [Mycena alexandri]